MWLKYIILKTAVTTKYCIVPNLTVKGQVTQKWVVALLLVVGVAAVSVFLYYIFDSWKQTDI